MASYCMYGFQYRKKTRFASSIPLTLKQCNHGAFYRHPMNLGPDFVSQHSNWRQKQIAYRIPYRLLHRIIDQVLRSFGHKVRSYNATYPGTLLKTTGGPPQGWRVTQENTKHATQVNTTMPTHILHDKTTAATSLSITQDLTKANWLDDHDQDYMKNITPPPPPTYDDISMRKLRR